MNGNYTYIIASIPVLSPDFKPREGDCRKSIEWIGSQLSGRDLSGMETVTDGFRQEKLTKEFYAKALKDSNGFIRKFFTADLHLRNAKAAYLNRELGRPESRDTIDMEAAGENPDAEKMASIFTGNDLLGREKAIDSYLWEKADELTQFAPLSLDKVYSTVVKLCIIDRWLSLDQETGREMLRKLTEDMRGGYGDKLEF